MKYKLKLLAMACLFLLPAAVPVKAQQANGTPRSPAATTAAAIAPVSEQEATEIATDAYIYGYSLINPTFDPRRHMAAAGDGPGGLRNPPWR